MNSIPDWLSKPLQAKVISLPEALQLLARSRCGGASQTMPPPDLSEQIAAARLQLWALEQAAKSAV